MFAVATLGCMIAGNIESLWLFRAMQGLCAGAPLVVGRAIIRDRFQGPEAQRLMSQVTLIFGARAGDCAGLGGVLLNTLGWRSIFGLLLALTLLTLAWTWRALPETLPRRGAQPLHPRALWRNYRAVLAQARLPAAGAAFPRSTSRRSSSTSPARRRTSSTCSAFRPTDSRGCSCR